MQQLGGTPSPTFRRGNRNARKGESNEAILDWVESIGGGYVWEPETFTVTLLGVPLSDTECSKLFKLNGVEQLALEAEHLSFDVLQHLCKISNLRSLVLRNCSLSKQELGTLRATGAFVELVDG